jgi:hypothetical protein
MGLKKSIQRVRAFWPKLLIILWFLLPALFAIVKYSLGPKGYNNYLIYKNVFWNTIHQGNLYDFYPGTYLYQNHYGPSFSFIIALFALMPDVLGIVLWCLVNAAFLYYAIKKLPLDKNSILLVMSIALLELCGSIQSQQFNPMLCSWIILAFLHLVKGRISTAAFFISGGILVKIYGVVGLLFTPFSGKFGKMIIWMLIAMLVLICIPMLYADASFVLHSYVDWYHRLLGKNQENIMTNLTDGMQDISAMGMVRRITGYAGLSNLWFLLPGGLLTLMPLLKRTCYDEERFRLFYLAQVLIGVVIFSTSAESPTYVIAVTGFAIWYAAFGEERPTWMKLMLLLLFILTILSPTDLFPSYIRNVWIKPYALKALPCILAWVIITYQLLFYRNSVVQDVDGHSA